MFGPFLTPIGLREVSPLTNTDTPTQSRGLFWTQVAWSFLSNKKDQQIEKIKYRQCDPEWAMCWFWGEFLTQVWNREHFRKSLYISFQKHKRKLVLAVTSKISAQWRVLKEEMTSSCWELEDKKRLYCYNTKSTVSPFNDSGMAEVGQQDNFYKAITGFATCHCNLEENLDASSIIICNHLYFISLSLTKRR